MEDDKKRALYRETFRSEDDLIVLTDILTECGFFDSYNVRKEDPLVVMTKQYLARYLLHQVGAWSNPSDVVRGIRNSSREV